MKYVEDWFRKSQLPLWHSMQSDSIKPIAINYLESIIYLLVGKFFNEPFVSLFDDKVK